MVFRVEHKCFGKFVSVCLPINGWEGTCSVGVHCQVTVADLDAETCRSFQDVRRLTKSRHRVIQRLRNLHLIKLDKIMGMLSWL